MDEKVSPEFRAALDYVWKEYSHYDGISLSEFTHKRGTAWYKALEKEKPYLNEDDIYGEAWIK